MNAKKIMGAVLVALLAAALFVGAGAAATDITDGQTVFVYQALDATNAGGTWTHANGVDTITFTTVDSYVAIVGTDIVEGVYSKGDTLSITV